MVQELPGVIALHGAGPEYFANIHGYASNASIVPSMVRLSCGSVDAIASCIDSPICFMHNIVCIALSDRPM